MSDLASPDARGGADPARTRTALTRSALTRTAFTRWPGLLSLSLGVLLGPVVALTNQGLTYAATIWACGHDARAAIHLVPALCLLVTLATLATAIRNWRAVGRGTDDAHATVSSRTRFLAVGGIAISTFCALLIVEQWIAVVVYPPCMRF